MKSMSKYLCLVWIKKKNPQNCTLYKKFPELCFFYYTLFVLLVLYFVTLHKALLNCSKALFSLGNDFWV